MANQYEVIPENMTIAEASEFWDTHSVADYPNHIVQMEYVPGESMTFVAIAHPFVRQIEQRAKENGISVETLINLWIQEKLAA